MSIQNFIKTMSQCCEPISGTKISANQGFTYFQLKGDKTKNRAGYNLFETSDGFLSGYACNFRTSESFSWNSNSDKVKSMSPEELKSHKKEMAILHERMKKEQEERYAERAKEAERLWKEATPIPADFKYLKDKGIKAPTVRQDKDGNMLLFVIVDGRISSLQTIYPDGKKRFMFGGKVKTGYFPITTKLDDTSKIIICEGFATGATIREAVETIPVIVAFNAGNLLPVAQRFRLRYPDSKIIIAGDSDQWRFKKGSAPEDMLGNDPQWNNWRDTDGIMENIGFLKATEAASRIKGYAVFPNVKEYDVRRRTDFNDVHKTEGINKVWEVFRPEIEDAPSLPVAMIKSDVTKPDLLVTSVSTPIWETTELYQHIPWQKQPSPTDPFGLPKRGIIPALLYLRHSKELGGVFRFNQFTQSVFVAKCPPWEDEDEFKVREIEDSDDIEIMEFMESVNINIAKGNIRDAILNVSKKNWFNPMLTFMEQLEWDGLPRLDNWLFDYFGAKSQNRDYLAEIGKRWLTSGVARVYENGCKAEVMLVLEGGQGSFKSTGLRVLAEVGDCGKEFSPFTDNISFSNIKNKDSLMIIRGKLILEFSELDGLTSKDMDFAKTWIATQVDEYRTPYGRSPSKQLRQCILAGTTNNSEWQPDSTGGRRFWAVDCSHDCNIDGLKVVRDQLWAEAVFVYKNEKKWWVDKGDPIHKIIESEQRKRQTTDIWDDIIKGYVFDRDFVTSLSVLSAIGVSDKDLKNTDKTRVSKCLTRLGFSKGSKRINNIPTPGWFNPMFKQKEEEVEIDF